MAKVPKAGVVLIIEPICSNRFRGLETANLLLGSLIVCSILAEIIRKWAGYKNYKGIVMSYILLSLSNIGSPLYVWVFSDYAISEASEEMSANYRDIINLDFSVVYGSCYCRNRSYLNNCRSYCKKGLQQAVCKCWNM